MKGHILAPLVISSALAACVSGGHGERKRAAELFEADFLDGPAAPGARRTVATWRLEARALVKRTHVAGFRPRLQRHALRIVPEGDDPMLVLREAFRANHVAVELKSEGAGYLDVYWAAAGEAFSESRKTRVPLRPSSNFETYEFDLWCCTAPLARPYHFRVDPVDQRLSVELRSILLSRKVRIPPASAKGPYDDATTLANETRKALPLQGGRWASAPLEIERGDRLAFGLARSKDDDAGSRLTVAFIPTAGGRKLLFTATLDPRHEARWADQTVELGAVAGMEGRFEFAAKGPPGGPAAGLTFVSRPQVFSPRSGHERPNLILVSLDTVAVQHLEAAEGSAFSRMLRDGVVFDKAYANSSVTDVSHASLLTGLLPLSAGALWTGSGVALHQPTLASFLRQAGYATLAVTGGVLLNAYAGFGRGFDSFYAEDTLFKDVGERSDARSGLVYAHTRIRELSGRRFFLFLHSYDAHGPYYVRPESTGLERGREPAGTVVGWNFGHVRGRWRLRPNEIGEHVFRVISDRGLESLAGSAIGCAQIAEIQRIYRREIAELNRQLGAFLAALAREGLLEDTVVVLTSDHGEAFLEHELIEHGLLYDENLRVPLAFWAPGRLPGGIRVGSRVSLVDVVPTALELLGFATKDGLDGRTLLPLIRGAKAEDRSFYAFVPGNGFAWFDPPGQKWIVATAMHTESAGRTALYRIDQDPGERDDRLTLRESVPAALRRAAEQTIDALPGIHLSLASFAGREATLALSGADSFAEFLHGWDVEVVDSRFVAERSARWRVRLGPDPRLVLVSPTRVTDFTLLVSAEAEQEHAFLVPASRLRPGEQEFLTSGDKRVLARRNGPERPAEEQSWEERRERLRGLGYIQ